jgi:hypothetical protein
MKTAKTPLAEAADREKQTGHMAFGPSALIKTRFYAENSEIELNLAIIFQPDNKKDVR